MKIRLLFAVLSLAFLCGLVLPASASAQESIRRFDTKTTITRDNKANVVETIVYDFGTASRHGIYRDIPIDYVDGTLKYYINFSLGSVRDENGKDQQTETSTENGNKRIRIGDPDRTITGVHTYVISYTLSPVIIEKSGSAFLNLDVIGEGWQVPINTISASVALEDDSVLQDVTWYGADNQSVSPGTFTADNLPGYSGVTINATLPQGFLNAPYLQPNTPRIKDVVSAIISILIASVVVLSLVGIVIVVIARAVRTHRRRNAQIVVAQYEPPAGMTPAHIGVLLDDTASNAEITATIIDWAVKGYLKIEFIPKKGWFTRKDYRLIQTNAPRTMSYSEQSLYEKLFSTADEKQSVLVSKLPASELATEAAAYKAAIKQELTKLDYYDDDGNILMHGTLTESGAKQWALVDGFKLYLSVVEKDRLAFSDAPAKTPERFNALLPYAIALGVEKQWAKQFEGIDITPSTNWYVGNLAAFSAISLASDLGGSFAQTVSSNSSVSSSGGSSGGGFGGGGGGSW